MKFFKKILLFTLLFFSFSGVVFANGITDPIKSFDSANCNVSTEAGAVNGGDFLDKMRECASGTAGVSIEDAGAGDNSVSGLSVRIKELASGFMRYAALFAIAAIVIAGVMYTTAYGDASKLEKAKKIVIFACV